ncbi:MAG TPA: hypothetical protein VIJ65_08380 [Acidobacteriaceae bacterium]
MMLRPRPTLTMPLTLRMNDTPSLIRSIRRLLLSAAAASSLLFAAPGLQAQTAPRASSLPATPPTTLSNPNSLPAPIAATSSGSNSVPHHKARVTYANGLLDVRADNSSLNQILRDISRETGMTIVGGVSDQRIFGNYGPAEPATVLKTLLDGTGTNMLLKETATEGPAQLVLTPQTGGASPPSPNSTSYDMTESESELQPPAQPQAAATQPRRAPGGFSTPAPANPTTPSPSLPPSMPQPLNKVNGNPSNVSPTAGTLPGVQSVPLDSLPTPSTAPSPTGIVDAPNPPPPGSTTANFTSQTPPDYNPNNPPPATQNPDTQNGTTTASPSTAKTPQQIYEELKRLQQKTPSPKQ